MSELDDIKRRHTAGYVTTFATPMKVIADYGNDIQYLLSKMEQYESFFSRVQNFIETEPRSELGYHVTHLQLNNMLVEFLKSIQDEKE